MAWPATLIVRHPKENPRKCSILPLRGLHGLQFTSYPPPRLQNLDGYLLLSADGPQLSPADASAGLVLLDGSWRRAEAMKRDFAHLPLRSLRGVRTAYPRTSKHGTDPVNGLASVEALYAAHRILGRPTAGLLDHYRWAAEFLALNGWAPSP